VLGCGCTRYNDMIYVGNEVSAFKSVPAAVYSFLRCMRPVSDIPDKVTA